MKEYDVTVEKMLTNSKPVIITRTVTANNPQAAKFRAIADILDSTSCGGQAKQLWIALSVKERKEISNVN